MPRRRGFPAHVCTPETEIRPLRPASFRSPTGFAAHYPGDTGLARDPAVLFADNFESGDMKKWDEPRGRVVLTATAPHSGKWSVHMPMERGKNTGGDAIKGFAPGADTVHRRFYLKFSADYRYAHRFVWLLAHQAKNQGSGFDKAG